MAQMLPELSEAQLDGLESRAEAKVYRAMRDGLPADYAVFFQVGWILRRQDEQAKDGETDFLVVHPDAGYLCVEVKGGGVGHDALTGDWFSVDRRGEKHSINNPIGQALRAKYSIRNKLGEDQRWKSLGLGNVMRGHSVFFPDIGDPRPLSRPDMPETLIGCAKDIGNIKAWVDGAFAYWKNDDASAVPLGRRGVSAMRDIFAKSFFAAPVAGAQLAEQERRRLALTNEQIRVLDLLMSHRRVAVSGGAGTGKTVLAVEKARRLAAGGFRTLLTCYNRQLADHLARTCAGTQNLDVMGFHQLCHRFVDHANRATGRDLLSEAQRTYPGKDQFDVHWPNALAYAAEALPDRYDAIVCDEGQDFREDFWVPLELLLSNYENGPLYVFYDDNQRLYTRVSSFPVLGAPFTLTKNCRNTAPIHTGAYTYYKGVPVSPPDNDGEEILYEETATGQQQAAKIGARIVDLIVRHGVSPGDITVLIADAFHKLDYYNMLKKASLPKPAVWVEEGWRTDKAVLMETVPRFKGLESPVIILWGLDGVDLGRHPELIYVGMSRAKSLLVVVGAPNTCHRIRSERPI